MAHLLTNLGDNRLRVFNLIHHVNPLISLIFGHLWINHSWHFSTDTLLVCVVFDHRLTAIDVFHAKNIVELLRRQVDLILYRCPTVMCACVREEETDNKHIMTTKSKK